MDTIKQALSIIKKHTISDEGGWLDGYVNNDNGRLKKELDYVTKNIARDKTILEYGSAPFIFTKALALENYNVIGTDINPDRFTNFEKLDLQILTVDYDKDPLPIIDESVDEIICNEVFEHMRGNLISTFKEAFRVLKIGGHIHITTPNVRSIKGLYMFIFKNKCCSCACDIYHEWEKINSIGHMGHVREYTAREVKDFLERIGFVVEKVYFIGQSTGGLKARLLNIFELTIPHLRPTIRIIARKQNEKKPLLSR
jgi:predicted SAM-dependent methyltransferase